MVFFRLRNSTDLPTLKVFGYSNFKIFFIIALMSFIFGWIILFAFNPITSTMMKYYEQTKSKYSKDIDHLVSINKNGLWIKENINDGYRIISADETRNNIKNVTIFNLDENNNLTSKIYSKEADISENKWILRDVVINKFENGISERNLNENSILSKYNYDKITSLFKNFDTMSFFRFIIEL